MAEIVSLSLSISVCLTDCLSVSLSLSPLTASCYVPPIAEAYGRGSDEDDAWKHRQKWVPPILLSISFSPTFFAFFLLRVICREEPASPVLRATVLSPLSVSSLCLCVSLSLARSLARSLALSLSLSLSVCLSDCLSLLSLH
jgi:hypothetical protein